MIVCLCCPLDVQTMPYKTTWGRLQTISVFLVCALCQINTTLLNNSCPLSFIVCLAPRPVIKVSERKARAISLGILDPVPQDTAKYLVRYKIKDLETVPWSTAQFTRPRIKTSSIAYITLDKLIPFTTYVTEISSAYKDGDTGPYSIPMTFTTEEDGEYILVSRWTAYGLRVAQMFARELNSLEFEFAFVKLR